MKKEKLISSIFIMILTISIISTLTLAQEHVEESTDLIGSDEIEIIDEEEENEDEEESDLEEIEELIEEEIKEEKDHFYKIKKITQAKGFIISTNGEQAEFFKGKWIVRKFIEENTNDIENAEVKTKSYGTISLGHANLKKHYKLELVIFDDEGIEFNVYNREKTKVGTLFLQPKKYDSITLWYGDLVLDSGNYIGSWSITATAKTQIVKSKINKPSRWNIFARSQRKNAILKEKFEEKLLDEEGLSEFTREHKGKDIKKIEIKKRTFKINHERVQEHREKFKERGIEIKETTIEELDELHKKLNDRKEDFKNKRDEIRERQNKLTDKIGTLTSRI